MNEAKGIIIELSDAIKQELQRQRGPSSFPTKPLDDDWEKVLPNPEATSVNGDDFYDPDQPVAISDTDSVVSTTPPYCLPVILVHLEAVTGCSGLTEPEKKEMQTMLEASIFNDFEASVTELFESGIAQHSTDLDASYDASRWVSISYPETLQYSYNTGQVWKQLLKPHDVPVVDKLLELLRTSNRYLIWKIEMRREILDLAESEMAQIHIKEYVEQRAEKLEQLYDARKVLQQQLDIAKETEATLLEERESTMQSQISHGLSNFDLNSKLFAFPDQQDTRGLSLLLGFRDEDEDDDDEGVGPSLMDDEYSDHSSEDERSDSGNEDEYGSVEDQIVERPAITKSSKERRRAKLRNHHMKLVEAEKEAEHQQKLASAKIEEERVREACTTPQLRVAIAKVQAIANKLEQVDNILENIQEQEWAAQESKAQAAKMDGSLEDESDDEITLLDQILAMILGAHPKPTNISAETHTTILMNTHLGIKREWKEHFGRLPRALSLKRQVPTKEDLGIVDNEKDNWEDDDSQENCKA